MKNHRVRKTRDGMRTVDVEAEVSALVVVDEVVDTFEDVEDEDVLSQQSV